MDDGRLVRALKALGDPKRFRMVQEIADAGELSCGQLGQLFELSQPTISHHLKLLLDAGILTARNQGQHHFISVDRELLDQLAVLLPTRLGPTGRKAVKRPARATRR